MKNVLTSVLLKDSKSWYDFPRTINLEDGESVWRSINARFQVTRYSILTVGQPPDTAYPSPSLTVVPVGGMLYLVADLLALQSVRGRLYLVADLLAPQSVSRPPDTAYPSPSLTVVLVGRPPNTAYPSLTVVPQQGGGHSHRPCTSTRDRGQDS